MPIIGPVGLARLRAQALQAQAATTSPSPEVDLVAAAQPEVDITPSPSPEATVDQVAVQVTEGTPSPSQAAQTVLRYTLCPSPSPQAVDQAAAQVIEGTPSPSPEAVVDQVAAQVTEGTPSPSPEAVVDQVAAQVAEGTPSPSPEAAVDQVAAQVAEGTPSPSQAAQTVLEYTLCPSPSPQAVDQAAAQVIEGTPSPSPEAAVDQVAAQVTEGTPSPSPVAVGVAAQVVTEGSPSPAFLIYTIPDASPNPAGGIATLCADTDCGGNPNIQVTVSGNNIEDLGLNIGVHCVCPDTYTNTAGTEYWMFSNAGGVPSDDAIILKADTATNSRVTFNNNYYSDKSTFGTGITGDIKDRLFTTLTAGGSGDLSTITLQRGSFW